MVLIQSTDVAMPTSVGSAQRRPEEQVPLLSNNDRYREPPLRHLWLGIQRSSWFLIVYLAFFMTYLSLGALVFGSMEQPIERQLRLEIRNRVDKFLYKFPSLPGYFETFQVKSFCYTSPLKHVILLWGIN